MSDRRYDAVQTTAIYPDRAASLPFEMGQVVSQTFGVIGRNAVSIFIVCFAMTLTGVLLGAAAHFGLLGASLSSQLWLNYLASLVSGIVTHAILLSGVTVIVMTDLDGRPVSFSRALQLGLQVCLPVMAIDVLILLGVFVGIILLIVPGLMLMVWWLVAVPVRVVEGPMIGGALARSRSLTKGCRWPIFALILGYVVLAGLVQGGLILAAGGYVAYTVNVAGYDPMTVGAGAVAGSILSAISTAGVSTIYAELRRIKEGASPNRLAAVFE